MVPGARVRPDRFFCGRGAGASYARRRSVGDFLLLFAYHSARLLAKLAGCELAPLLQAASGPLDRFQNRSAELVHHFEPRDAQKQRHTASTAPATAAWHRENSNPGKIRSREISEYAAGAARQSRTAPCSVARPQLVPSVSANPGCAAGIDPRAGIRQHRFLMDQPTCVGSITETNTPDGQRGTGKTPASQAPTGPIQLPTGPVRRYPKARSRV